MSVKLYKEILEFLNNQKAVIMSFGFHSHMAENEDVKKFINDLSHNINKCKENIERIVDK